MDLSGTKENYIKPPRYLPSKSSSSSNNSTPFQAVPSTQHFYTNQPFTSLKMRFNLTHAVTALSLFSATVTAIVTPAQVVQNIQTLTEKSRNLQAPAQSINIINGPLLVVGLGPFPVSRYLLSICVISS